MKSERGGGEGRDTVDMMWTYSYCKYRMGIHKEEMPTQRQDELK